ncbi:MAG: isochorismatase family protein [Solirubrobacteraceae bacterium]
MTQPWSDVITADDEARYRAAGFGRPGGPGRHPALLIIDVQYRTVGNSPKPFFDSVRDDYPTSCGEVGWAAVEQIALLLAAFRARSLPVIYPHVAAKRAYDAGRLAAKVPAIMDIPEQGYRFVEAVQPTADDILIPKRHPSAFFATALTSYLIDLGADWLIVTGCTTSGCIRASVVDGFAFNFRITVPHDAVYDRSPTVHAVNLFDIAQKYADVASAADVIGMLPEAGAAG